MKNIYKIFSIVFFLIFLLMLYYLPIARLKDGRIIFVFFTPEKTALCFLRFVSFTAILYILTLWGKILKDKCFRGIDTRDFSESLVINSGLGFGLLIIFSFLLLSVGLFYKIPLVLFFIAPLLFLRKNKELFASIIKAISEKCKNTNFTNSLFFFIPFMLLFPTFILLFVPPLSRDELVYHLVIPQTYMKMHKFFSPENIFYFDIPQNIDVFYSGISMLYGNTSLCVFFNAWMGVISALIIYLLGKKCFSKEAGILAAMVFILAPVVTKELKMAYSDIGTTFYFLLSLYIFIKALEDKKIPAMVLSAIFLGITLGCKYTALYCLISMILPSLMFVKFKRTNYFIYFWVIAGALVLPWLIKNYIMTGNPVFPNLHSVFEGKNWNAHLSTLINEWLQGMGMGKTLPDFLKLPWRLSVKGWFQYELFADILSPFFFFPMIFIPIVLLRDYSERKLNLHFFIFSAIGFVFLLCWFKGSQQMRFLVPGLPVYALISSYLITRIMDKWENAKNNTEKSFFDISENEAALQTQNRSAGYKRIFLSLYVVFAFYSTATEHEAYDFVQPGFHVAFGNLDTPAYITRIRRANSYNAIQWINKNLPENAKLLMLFENCVFYLEREYVADGTFEASWTIECLDKLDSEKKWLEWMREKQITHVLWHQGHWAGASGIFINKHYPDFYGKYEKFKSKYLLPINNIEGIEIYSIKSGA